MAAFTYPGVYIEELPSGQHTITGVATSIGAFVGWAPMGPVTEATLVTSWAQYATQFGGLDTRSWLGYAVNQFFANGGDQCYIVRLAWEPWMTGGVNSPVAAETALASGVGYSTATITAAWGSLSASLVLGVGTPVLQSISVTVQGLAAGTALPPLPSNATLALAAVGSSSDGSTSTPPGVVWESSDTSIATVSAGGVVTAGTQPGTVTISAASGIIAGNITLTVTTANITSIVVSPVTVTAEVGQTVQLAAAAKYADGTAPDITGIAVFACAAGAGVATFTGTTTEPLAPGQFYAAGASAGTTISAALPAAWTLPAPAPTQVSAELTVGAATVVGMTISPANATVSANLLAGQTEPPAFTETMTLSDGSTESVSTVTWASSNPSVAAVDVAGNLTVAEAGTTTITATYAPGGSSAPITASTQLTVSSGHLTGLSMSPSTLTLAAKLSQQLTVTGTFDNGTFVNMTGYAQWASTSGAATVSASGLVQAQTAGSATITATWMGVSASATVTVTAAIPESIVITTSPAGQTSVPAGQNLTLVVNAVMSDGSTQTVPASSATWTSSSPMMTIGGPGVVSAAATAGGSLTLFASSPGAWGNSLRVSVTPQSSNPSRFSVLVQQLATTGQLVTLESFVNLSVQPTDPSYVVTVINNDSSYITFTNPLAGSVVTPSTAPPAAATAIPFTGGADGTVLNPTDGNFELALLPPANPDLGVNLLDRVPIFNLLCVPGETDGVTIGKLQAYCVEKRAFMIVDSPQYTTIANMIQSGPVGSTAGSITEQNVAGNSAQYFPWVQAPDPLVNNRTRLFPPCGFVAGIYAATDASRGVWKAPAGIQAGLTGNAGLQYVMTELENGGLNPQAVNCLREFKIYGDLVWGARTLAGNDEAGSQWKYVPIRRLALYLESSLYDGTQWVVFEPNDSTLWGQIRMNVGTFMQGLFLQGAFAGTTPAQAYFVKCDADNNPPASVALGVVNILVGFAPLYPAEFVVIEIQQIVAQAS